MKIWIKSFIALVLGLIVGLFLPYIPFLYSFFETLEQLFFKFLLFSAKPLIFLTLIIAFYRLKENNQVIKIFIPFFLITLAFSFFAILQTSLLGYLIKPGEGLKIFDVQVPSDILIQIPSFKGIVLNFIPKTFTDVFGANPALLIPTLLLALLIGISIIYAVKRGQIFFNLVRAAEEIFEYISLYSIEIFSFAIFFVTINVVTSVKIDPQIGYLLKFFIIFLFALIIQAYILPVILIPALTKTNPAVFFRSIWGAQISALALGSTKANYSNIYFHTYKNLGIPKHISAPLSTLGIIFNYDGAAIFATLGFFFLYQIFRVSFISYFEVFWLILVIFLVFFNHDGFVNIEIPLLLYLLSKVAIVPIESIGLLYIGLFLIKRFSAFISTTSILTINYIIANKFFKEANIASVKDQI